MSLSDDRSTTRPATYLTPPRGLHCPLGRAGARRRRGGPTLHALTLHATTEERVRRHRDVTSYGSSAEYKPSSAPVREQIVRALLSCVLHHRPQVSRSSRAGAVSARSCGGVFVTARQRHFSSSRGLKFQQHPERRGSGRERRHGVQDQDQDQRCGRARTHPT